MPNKCVSWLWKLFGCFGCFHKAMEGKWLCTQLNKQTVFSFFLPPPALSLRVDVDFTLWRASGPVSSFLFISTKIRKSYHQKLRNSSSFQYCSILWCCKGHGCSMGMKGARCPFWNKQQIIRSVPMVFRRPDLLPQHSCSNWGNAAWLLYGPRWLYRSCTAPAEPGTTFGPGVSLKPSSAIHSTEERKGYYVLLLVGLRSSVCFRSRMKLALESSLNYFQILGILKYLPDLIK